MAKVRYIKLSDAVEKLEKEKQAAERGFEAFGFENSFIHAVACDGIITMLKELPTVEMEETNE